jgi:hypothetical protein
MLDIPATDGIIMPDKPARKYVAKVIPHPSGSGHLAQFAFPGVIPLYVSDDGIPIVYDTEDEAKCAALDALFKSMNKRPREGGKRERYKPLSGSELAILTAEAGLAPSFFCYLWGTTTERFFEWIDEVKNKDGRVMPVPHPVRVMLEIFKDKDIGQRAIDIAEKVTEQVTTERKPR